MLSVMGRGMARGGDRAAEKKGTACARRGSLGGRGRRGGGDVFGRAAYTAGSSPNHWQIAS